MAIIKNIRQLKGAAVLADRTAKTSSLDFLKFNLIYGFNGSGKSTLSRIFSSLQQGKKHERLPDCTFEIEMDDGSKYACPKALGGIEKRVCVFNSDFIAENLRWDDAAASPVFYIGADQAEAKAQLDELEKKLPLAESNVASERAILKEREKALATFKKTAAQQVAQYLKQSERYEAPQLVRDYAKLPYSADNILAQADFDAAAATCARSEPPPKVNEVNVPADDIFTTLAAAIELVPKSIGSVMLDGLADHPEMVPWAKVGHEYHIGHKLTDCLYCGEPISTKRRALLTAAFDDKLTIFIKAVNGAASSGEVAEQALKLAAAAIPAAAQLSAEFQPAFEKEAALLTTSIDEIRPLLETALGALRARRAMPTMARPMSLPPIKELEKTIATMKARCNAVNAICKQHGDMVDTFNAHQAKAREAIRKHFLAKGEKAYKASIANQQVAEDNVTKAVAALDNLRNEIAVLNAKVKQHGQAADAINALVKSYLGHSELTIVPIADGYELHRHGKLVEGAPSEGEKTAIALCYFLSTLEAEGRSIKDLIVVIDDPVSSLDTKAMNYSCTLIRNRLGKVAQLFVLTHNQHCMNEFKKAWKGLAASDNKKQTARLFFMDVTLPQDVNARISSIVPMPKQLRQYDSEYHFLFQKVLQFEETGAEYFEYAFMMPNVLRRVLEIFTAFKVPRDGNIGDKLLTLASRYPMLDADRLAGLERLTQVESHSDNLEDIIAHSSMTIEESRDGNASLVHLMRIVDADHLSDLRTYCKPV